MKRHLNLAATLSLAFVLTSAGSVNAAALIDRSIAADTTETTDWLLEGATAGGTTATWTIDPGVTYDGSSRFFIETNTDPDGEGRFVVAGGGTLISDAAFSMRLGHSGGLSGVGVLIIEDGSFVDLNGTFTEDASGGRLELNGTGSSFQATGTFAANAFNSVDVLVNGLAPITAGPGQNLLVETSGGITTLTVIPTPAALPAGLAMLGLAAARRHRNR